MKQFRVWLAFVVAPLVTPVVFVVVEVLEGRVTNWQALFGYLLVFSAFTYPSVAVFGVPSYLIFRKWRVTSVGAYALAGAVIGLLSAIAWIIVFRFAMVPTFFASCLVSSLLSVLLFRRIANAGA